MSSIFVNIAAYHDYELPKTIDNFINNSSGKNDIFFGVHYVFENEDNINIQNYNNIKFIASKAPDNLSPGLGRYLAHSLYNKEDYYMMIDSHSRVCKDWDELLISDIDYYKELGHNKPVLTNYPATYSYDINGNEILSESPMPENIDFRKDEDAQKLFKEYLNTINKGCLNNTKYQKSISGGFTFTVCPYIQLNKDICFSEEFPIGAMLYTNGFDLLIPRNQVIYHWYSGPEKGSFEEYNRRSVWHYKKNIQPLHNYLAVSRDTVYKMFKEKIIGEGYLGSERTLEEYAEYANLDFVNGVIL
jgi:hypothetical protein